MSEPVLCGLERREKKRNKDSQSYSRMEINNRKAKGDFLDKLVSTHKLTPDGKEWLTAALDPFHDYSHPIAGYPDADVSQTVVSCYQYQAEIKAPAGVAGSYDAHLFTTPYANAGSFSVLTQGAAWGSCFDPAVPQAQILGLLSIVTGATGDLLIPQIPAVATTNFQSLPSTPQADIEAGISRVIALGFEVHNATAEIYKQGSVTSYRMPQIGTLDDNIITTNGKTSKVVSRRYLLPPSRIAEAVRMKGSRTWNAADGVYANCFQNGVHNPLAMQSKEGCLFSFSSSPTAANTMACLSPTFVGGDLLSPYPTKLLPFDTTGCYFTGLSNQTVLNVKLRVYVERAPSWQTPDLIPLASPSAGYDVAALELYAQAINMLPCAVKVGENAAGDWWRSVVSVLRHVAGPIGAIANTFVPGAGLVGSALQTVLGQIDSSKPIAKQAAARAIAERPKAKTKANTKRK